MLIELKRCNSVGNIDGILFLVSIMAGKSKITKNEIRNRCVFENGIVVNCPGAVAFFEYLGLVEATSDSVTPLSGLNALADKNSDTVIKELIALCIKRLAEDGIFDKNTTGFDTEKGRLTFKRSAFPLAYAGIRNFLILAGALDRETDGDICVTESYESGWTEQLGLRRRKFTLEQLLKQQEEQSKRGLEAEEFVLALEKSRLPTMGNMIKRISDFDVSAGYDIVSFRDAGSGSYDRFIEVKCYVGSPHFFWSENESDVAKIKADKYFLCLVDYARMGDPGYVPEYIGNPYEKILNNEEWLVNPASYRVQKI